jgi:putative two-component system response regulator
MKIPTPQKNILLVEDNYQIRMTIARELELANYQVMLAENGQKGLESLRNSIPDLIISDINMPKMDGYAFYQELRKVEAWTTIPFIFLTSNDAPEDIQAGRELGVEDYLTKPIEPDNLLGIVNARLLRTAQLQIAHIGKAYRETVQVLANTIEGRDPYTHGHVERVRKYTRWLAETVGWPEANMQTLEFGAMLHDLGKIMIPDQILKKPGPLSPAEWQLMRQHPAAGAKIVRDISLLKDTIPFILYHHEKWDGSGYPEGLVGENIPIEGRMLALADVFDALTTTRPYRPARPVYEVLEFIKLKAGSYFDPDLTGAFMQSIKKRYRKETGTISM